MTDFDYAIDYKFITARDWQDALYVQSASNLSGVLISMSHMVSVLRREAEAQFLSWDWVDHHPILSLYAYQVSFLTGNENFGVGEKWNEWNKLAEYYVDLAKQETQ